MDSTEEDNNNSLFVPKGRSIGNIKVVLRSQWGASESKFVEKVKESPAYMVATWTGTETCSNEEECIVRMQEIQNADINEEGLPDIKYNFLIGRDGNVYEGRGWNVSTNVSDGDGKHLSHLDGKSIYIAFIGRKDDIPHPFMLLALSGLCSIGISQGVMNRNVQYVNVNKGQPTTHDHMFEENLLETKKEEEELYLKG